MDRTARGEFDLDAAGRALISDLDSVEKVRTGNSGAELV
jgi:2,4-dienoyl-CoA reductase-like NADH-dependent reductase (Old Yellow Enzyme family)